MGLNFYEDDCIGIGSVLQQPDSLEVMLVLVDGCLRFLDLNTYKVYDGKIISPGKYPTSKELRYLTKELGVNFDTWECICN